MKCDFEPTVQFDLVREMIKDIRSGEAAKDPWMIIEKASCVLGSFAAWMRGEDKPGDEVQAANLGALPQSVEECCAALDDELAKPSTAAINPLVVMLIKQLVSLLVAKYVK